MSDTLVRGQVTRSRAQQFWDEQAEWSRATFGSDKERGPVGPLKHLEKEAKEAWVEAQMLDGFRESKKTNRTPDYDIDIKGCEKDLRTEIADCLFLTFDAARRAGMTLDELINTAFEKLEINKSRKWGKPTADGPVEHIRE